MMLRNASACVLSAALLGWLPAVQASTTYDFTSGGTPSTETGSGFGNQLNFDTVVPELTVNAWGTTGNPNSLLESGKIFRFNTGLGACNRSEGVNCNSPDHQVDNIGDDDLVLFLFDQTVVFDNLVIDPFGRQDRDVSFWTASLSPAQADLTDLDPATLINGSSIFGAMTIDNNPKSRKPRTIELGGATGNALLFGGKLNAGDYDNDAFKISSLTVTAVPVPAAVWLFASGLVGMVGVARRKRG